MPAAFCNFRYTLGRDPCIVPEGGILEFSTTFAEVLETVIVDGSAVAYVDGS